MTGDDAEGLDRATVIVVEALDLEGDERRRFVEQACGGDAELRAEVDSLLAENDLGEPDFLDVPAPARIASLDTTITGALPGAGSPVPASSRSPSSSPTGALPERIGPYRIVDRLGEGGMATVYLAEQDQPVRRKVALKVIRALRQPRASDRFSVEAQALARLNHPNVAALYEFAAGGEMGLPYVAMEWVEGEHVTTWCDARNADLATRLQLFLGVCAGIRHAHEKGVLHCDLKPSNVLVTEVDGRAVAKVIDFGIARALDEPLIGGDANLTGEMFVGSPVYVSPEAARLGGRKTLDARSDVYSLGLILYELLAGVLPFEPDEHTVWSLLDHLKEREPPLPSARFCALDPTRAAELAARRGLDRAGLARALRGDLGAIVNKAIAREPQDRYGSPIELAAELQRYLRHQPVEARGGATAYVFGRFVRRHVGAVASIALLLAALAAGLVARTVEARRANAEAERARAALAESEQVRELIVGLFEGADPELAAGETITVRELLDQGAERLRDELSDQPLVRATLLHTIGAIYTKLGTYPSAEELIAEALALRESRLPGDHPEVLDSRSELGLLHRRQGRFAEAEPLLAAVLAARLASPDADPRLIATAYNNVGNLYWSQERYSEAEIAHRAALSIRERLPDGGPDTAASANNLGVLLMSRGRNAEARPLLERAVELTRAELGPRHPRVAAGLSNLGLVERNLESWAQAEGRFRQAVTIWEGAYGEDHPRPLLARRNLVDELRGKHRWDEALAESRAVVAVAERLDGAPVSLVAALRQQGRTESRAGLTAAALATLERTVELSERVLGPEHGESQWSRHAQAVALVDAAEVDRAVAILEEIARSQDGTVPFDHPSRLRTEGGLGYAAMAAGRYGDAEAHYRRVLDAQASRLGEQHRLTGSALHDLGRSVAAQGRDDEAADLLARALRIRLAVRGPQHPEVASTAHELALVEQRRGNLERARQLLDQAVAVRRAVYPAGDDDLLASLEALAAL